MDVHHGAIEVVAYQETLLIMAVFGIIVLAMIWAGFRRWLQYKEKIGRMIAEQSAERSAQSLAQMERVEERLKAIEQIVTDRGAQTAAQIEAPTGMESRHPIRQPPLSHEPR
jgi:hypothetical protein